MRETHKEEDLRRLNNLIGARTLERLAQSGMTHGEIGRETAINLVFARLLQTLDANRAGESEQLREEYRKTRVVLSEE